jgi:hypothetical protein
VRGRNGTVSSAAFSRLVCSVFFVLLSSTVSGSVPDLASSFVSSPEEGRVVGPAGVGCEGVAQELANTVVRLETSDLYVELHLCGP